MAGRRAADRCNGRADLESLLPALFGHYGAQGWWPARTRLEMMAGAILTQRTQWPVASAAAGRLRRAGWLHWPQFARAGSARLAALIRPCGDHAEKARRLAALGQFLRGAGGPRRLAGLDTAALRKRLLEVRGIGPETADAILLYAYARPVFVADAYAIRLLSRLGWLPWSATGQRYAAVQAWVGARLTACAESLGELHALIVSHGKAHCRSRPRCEACPLLSRCATGRPVTGSRSPGR